MIEIWEALLVMGISIIISFLIGKLIKILSRGRDNGNS